MKTRIFHSLITLFLSLILLTCRDDVADNFGFSDEKRVTIALKVPGCNLPELRSMDGDKESEINEIDILAFKYDNGNFVFEYHAKGEDIKITNPSGAYKAEFKANLTEGDDYNLLIIANAEDIITQILPSLNTGTPIEEVSQALEFQNMAQWAADENGTYKTIPMAGITGRVTIEHGTTLPEIDVVRMLSRIDVVISTTDFTLQRIHLCNYNTKGYIIPILNTEKTAFENPATTPNLPDNTDKQLGTDLSFKYDVSGTSSFRGEIYTFESATASDDNETSRQNATCLLLEGTYNGGTYFYRIDFTTEGDSEHFAGEYMPLLRNHNYIIDVLEANGIGYTSPEEALASYTVPSNMRTRIISWKDGEIKEFVFNGQYFLGVGKSEFILNESAHNGSSPDNKLLVTTNYPGGWKVEKILEGENVPDWLNTEGSFSSINSKDELTLLLSSTTDTRTGHVYLKAGRLSMVLTVIQMAAYIPEFDFLRITPDPADGDLPGDVETTTTITVRTNDSWIIKNSLGDSKSMQASPIGEKELSLTIPTVTDLWNDREIIVWAEHEGTKYGETTYLQKAIYNISNATTNPVITTTIPGQGETYTVTVFGNYPEVAVRAYDEANDKVLDIDMLTASSTSEQIEFTIPNNGTGYVRNIFFQYEKEPGVWANMLETTQAKGNFLLKTGRLVGLVDGKRYGTSGSDRPTWSEAMGIDVDYDYKHFYKENGSRDDNLNKVYNPTHDTGCGQYWEGDEFDPKTGVKCWRLPHFDEIVEISENYPKGTIDGLHTGSQRYWYSTENPSDVGRAGIMLARTGQFGINQGKTNGMLIRCVRDQ